MSDVTRILDRVQHGDPKAAEQLLPLVYDELRKLAAARMAALPPGQTLQATALVHEAWRGWPGRATTIGMAADSSPPPPKRCGASWWTAPGTKPRRSGAAACGLSIWTTSMWRWRRTISCCWRWTKPWRDMLKRIRKAPS